MATGKLKFEIEAVGLGGELPPIASVTLNRRLMVTVFRPSRTKHSLKALYSLPMLSYKIILSSSLLGLFRAQIVHSVGYI